MTVVPAPVGVDPRADAAVAGSEQVEVESQSSTEVVASDAEDEDIVLVELPESSLACPQPRNSAGTPLPAAHLVWTLRT